MDPTTTETDTLSLHDALPILTAGRRERVAEHDRPIRARVIEHLRRERSSRRRRRHESDQDRKSTRLNSSHSQISYAVFCLKKNKTSPEEVRANGPCAA